MATIDQAAPSDASLKQKRIINDMSIQVATVNGSGSQSSNTVFLRSIFQMGIPVSGKESLPIQYCRPADLVHDSRQQRWLDRAAKKEIDFLIAMNAEPAREDVMGWIPAASSFTKKR